MSDESLSRWIAEKLEPLSSLPDVNECDKQDMDEFPTECWISTFELSPVTLMHVPYWAPHDMIHDPAMTLLLQDEIAKGPLYAKVLMSDGLITIDGPTYHLTARADHGRTWAEAYALANGLEER